MKGVDQMENLNVETFTKILLAAAKDDESKIQIIEAELAVVSDLMIVKVGELLDELDEIGYKSKKFQKIVNIKNNTECLIEMLDELKEGVSNDS